MYSSYSALLFIKICSCSQPDGTAETKSYFIFAVTEYDSGIPFTCQAENSVMMKEGIKPLKETTTIEVLCEYTYCLHESPVLKIVEQM